LSDKNKTLKMSDALKQENVKRNSITEGQFFFETVVQVHSFIPEVNPIAPFQISGTKRGLGSGFFITENIFMTAAHVVLRTYKNTGVKITVPSIGHDKMFSCRIITIIPEIDIALVLVTDPDFPKRTSTFYLDDDRKLTPGDNLMVIGFPMGDSNIKVTRSTFNGLQDGVIQIDSSINPGNSGGPVVLVKRNIEGNKEEERLSRSVIGIVSSGYDPSAANSVSFAIPINTFIATLTPNCLDPMKITDNTRVLRLPSLGMIYHNGTNVIGCEGGVVVQWVAGASTLFNIIKIGDKLCAINEQNIDNVGEVKVPWYDSKIPLSQVIMMTPVGTTIKIDYWDSKDSISKSVSTILKPSFTGSFQNVYYPFESLQYESFAGIIVMPLRIAHFMKYKHLFFKMTPSEREKEHLVISYILPNCLVARNETLSGGQILKSVNGFPVSTLSQYVAALKQPCKYDNSIPYMEWITTDNEKVDLLLKDILHDQSILNDDHIPTSDMYNYFLNVKNMLRN
jgi:S1-C subfamily serine protease